MHDDLNMNCNSFVLLCTYLIVNRDSMRVKKFQGCKIIAQFSASLLPLDMQEDRSFNPSVMC